MADRLYRRDVDVLDKEVARATEHGRDLRASGTKLRTYLDIHNMPPRSHNHRLGDSTIKPGASHPLVLLSRGAIDGTELRQSVRQTATAIADAGEQLLALSATSRAVVAGTA